MKPLDKMQRLGQIAYEMSEMAANHKDNTISNALAATSSKIETLGKPFASELDKTDLSVLKYFLSEKSRRTNA